MLVPCAWLSVDRISYVCRESSGWFRNLAYTSFLKDQVILVHLNGRCDLALLSLSTGDL